MHETARRPENELLLYSARTSINASVTATIQRIASGSVAWERLVQQAVRQGVAPLVYRSLNRVAATWVPDDVRSRLRDCFERNAARSFLLTAELFKLLRQLEDAGIKAIPFKGPTLAAAAYGDLTLRQFGDLDILIHREDWERTKNLLLAQGYLPWRPLTEIEEAAQLKTEHAYTFVRTDGIAKVDLHWRITQDRYSFGIDPESLWDRLDQVSLGGKSVPTLHAEDLLIVLCVHGSKHCWERLAWICDVAELVRAKPKLNWEEIIRRSAALQIGRAVLLGFDLAKSLLDAPLPELILSAIRHDRGVRWVSSLIQKRLFARRRKFGPLERAVLFCMTRERLQDRFPHMVYSFRRAATLKEIDTSVCSLPNSLYFLYYPWRAMRLTRDTVGRLFSRVQ
jgi:hypothetical protein